MSGASHITGLLRASVGLAAFVLAGGLATSGCVGTVLDPGQRAGGGDPSSQGVFAETRVWRLTPAQYHAAVAALAGTDDFPRVTFPIDPEMNGYVNNAEALRTNTLLVQALWNDAPAIASAVAAAVLERSPCASGETEDACARRHLTELAERAYRRPPTQEEVSELMAVFEVGREDADFRDGLAVATRVLVQSFDLIYRTELGEPGASDALVTLTPYEVAQAVAYTIGSAPPDAELLEAARTGEIMRPEVREREALRLLDRVETADGLGVFAAHWLDVADIESQPREATAFPEWPSIRTDALEETRAFFTTAVVEDDATLGMLFTARWTVASDALGEMYGATRESEGRWMLPPERSGVLTQIAVVGGHSQSFESSPPRRGHLVRTRLLCQSINAPPNNLEIRPPDPDPTLTTRERWERTTAANSTCWNCHAQMDPIGYAFEGFDAIGRHRPLDNGRPVDLATTLTGSDVDGPFDGPAELGELLAESTEAHECFAEHWYEYAMGRAIDAPGRAALRGAARDFLESGGSVRDLIVGIVRSDRFVLRRRGS